MDSKVLLRNVIGLEAQVGGIALMGARVLRVGGF